jgi:hypothetical protein
MQAKLATSIDSSSIADTSAESALNVVRNARVSAQVSGNPGPAAPAGLDMVSLSDSGALDGDDSTSITTPTIVGATRTATSMPPMRRGASSGYGRIATRTVTAMRANT